MKLFNHFKGTLYWAIYDRDDKVNAVSLMNGQIESGASREVSLEGVDAFRITFKKGWVLGEELVPPTLVETDGMLGVDPEGRLAYGIDHRKSES